MINILYTINFLTNGGPTRVLQNIIYSLDITKYNITVLTLINENNKKIVDALKKYGVEVIELNYAKKAFDVFKNKNKIIKLINKINPDIIHTHGIVTTLIVSSSKIKSRKITTIHNNMYEDYKYSYGRIKGLIIAELHIKKLKKFNKVVCCSKTSYEILNKRLKNTSYIRNGIDIIKPQMEIRKIIRKELNINEDAIVYIYGGVISKRKRVVELVNIFNTSLEENEYLIIAGDGSQKEFAEKVKSEKIKFVGFKTNIIDYFSASDVYVSYSSSEGFSISIIEALGCGLLCLLSDIPSHKECFEIDKEYYIGENFNYKDFKYKKHVISNKLKDIDRYKIEQFQNKYLSARAMSEEYEKIYIISEEENE